LAQILVGLLQKIKIQKHAPTQTEQQAPLQKSNETADRAVSEKPPGYNCWELPPAPPASETPNISPDNYYYDDPYSCCD
jgi:hypothetical protein